MNNKKQNESVENKCTCKEGVCDCKNTSKEYDYMEDLISNTYTVSFDGLCEEDLLEDECKIDTKKLALIGLGALLVGGTACFIAKKKKRK